VTGAAEPEPGPEPLPEPLPLLQIRDRLRRVSALSLVMLLVFGVFAGFYTSQQNGRRLDDTLSRLTESDKERAASDADRKKLLILVNAQNNAIAALQDQLRQLGAVPVVPGAPTTPASPGPIPPGPTPSGGTATPHGGSGGAGNRPGTGGGGARTVPSPSPSPVLVPVPIPVPSPAEGPVTSLLCTLTNVCVTL
jgi:hypothetical protein